MGARQKLNTIYLTGALILAALVGLLAQSVLAFFVALVILVVCSLDAGDIRPRPNRRKSKKRKS